jgi:hypothetical protein
VGEQPILANLTNALCRFYTFALVGTEAKQRLEDGAVTARAIGDESCEAPASRVWAMYIWGLMSLSRPRQCFEEALTLFQSTATSQVKPTASEVWALCIGCLMSLSRHGNVLKKP